MKLRFLESGEGWKVLRLAYQDATAVGINHTKINDKKLAATFEACIANAAIIVAEQDDIVGVMALCLVESFWSDDYSLTNLLYWVDPDHRNSRAGEALLKAASEYARETGLEFNLRVESYQDNHRKDKFFKRHGFMATGANYRLRD